VPQLLPRRGGDEPRLGRTPAGRAAPDPDRLAAAGL